MGASSLSACDSGIMAAFSVRVAIERGGNNFAQARQALGVEERAALVRRSRQQHHELTIAVKDRVKPLARCAPVGIRQHQAPSSTSACFRLFCGMVMRHVAARACSAATWARRGAVERERISHGFSRQVVFRGPEAAHQHHMSTRPSPVRMALARSRRRSPTIVLNATRIPIC